MRKLKFFIRKLYHLLWFLSLFIFFYVPKVNGAVDVSASFNSQSVDTTWTIASNGSKNGSTRFISNNDITGNFIYADVCTTGYEPTIWVTQDIEGKAITSSKWYKVNVPCYASGYKATVYRQIIYITRVNYDAGNPNVFSIYFTDRLFSNTDYTTYMRLLHLGISDTIPLEDLMYDETTTQTSILNDILSELRSNPNVDQQILQSNQAILQQEQQANQNLNDIKDSITNDSSSGAQSSAGDFFSNFNTNNFGLTGIITLPLNLISSITSSSCSNLVLPLPFVNQNLTLPCMSSIYSQYFGSLFSLYQLITDGIISYWICIKVFELVKGFKDPETDKIEVLDL